ncbi:MAG: hypothetical protein QXQ57_04590 [Sulfolobales archaeon]
MQEDICESLAKELAYIENSGCLRYIRIDYSLLSEACRLRRLWRDAEQRFLEVFSEVKRSSEICRMVRETPEHIREELYGQIYVGIKKAIDLLEEYSNIARKAISPIRRTALGFSASIILLGISNLILIPQNLLILALLITIVLFSALNIALTRIEPRLSIKSTLILCLALLVSSILIGDNTKIYASSIILALLVLNSIVLATKL